MHYNIRSSKGIHKKAMINRWAGHIVKYLNLHALSTRLFLVILIAVLPLFALTLYSAPQTRSVAFQEEVSSALHQAAMVAEDQNQVVARAKGILDAIGAAYPVMGEDPARCASFLSRLIAGEPEYVNLRIASAEGAILCAARTTTAEMQDPSLISDALEAEGMVLGGLPPAGATVNDMMILAERVSTKAVAEAILRLDWLAQTAQEIQEKTPGAELSLVDRNGQVLISQPGALQWPGQRVPLDLVTTIDPQGGAMNFAGPDGRLRMYAILPLPYGFGGKDALIMVGLPTIPAYTQGVSILRMDLFVSLLVVLLGLAAARWSAGWLVIRWLRPLIAAAQRLEAGDLTARTGVGADRTELGHVVHAFDSMAAALQTRTEELHETAAKFRNLFDGVPIGLYRTTLDGQILDINPALCKMLGYPDQDGLKNINVSEIYLDPVDHQSWGREVALLGELVNREAQLRRADGKAIWVLDNSRAVHDPGGNVLWCEGSLQDITRRKQAEQALTETNQHLSSILNSITEAYIALDYEWRFLEVNPVATNEVFLGRSAADLLGKIYWEEFPQSYRSEFHRQYTIAMAEQHPVHFEAESKINGRWWEAHAYPYPGRLAIYMRDITERKRGEAFIREMAYHDPLTGLLNRKGFTDRVEQEISRARRNDQKLVVLFIDLDGFKEVNDTYGHDAGDRVLCEVARRLKVSSRREDVITRMGGDEFILVGEIQAPGDPLPIAERIREELAHPMDIDEVLIHLTPSIGASVFPDDGEDPRTLLVRADQAMYLAKTAGKNCIRRFGEASPLTAGGS